jgi:hypothetical protein
LKMKTDIDLWCFASFGTIQKNLKMQSWNPFVRFWKNSSNQKTNRSWNGWCRKLIEKWKKMMT